MDKTFSEATFLGSSSLETELVIRCPSCKGRDFRYIVIEDDALESRRRVVRICKKCHQRFSVSDNSVITDLERYLLDESDFY